jgi:REP element-mobilizing transposase RayT
MTTKRISNKPPRWKENNAYYFLTFCAFNRRQVLHNKEAAKIILDDLRFYEKYVKEIIAYTIMPDHIHLLIEIEDVRTLSIFLQRFKSHSSKNIQEALHCKGGHIWQYGTMDHCIRDEVDFENHLMYVFYNSQKHLGISPKDFDLHNFKAMVEKGWMEEEFCAFPEEKEKKFSIYE